VRGDGRRLCSRSSGWVYIESRSSKRKQKQKEKKKKKKKKKKEGRSDGV